MAVMLHVSLGRLIRLTGLAKALVLTAGWWLAGDGWYKALLFMSEAEWAG